MKKTIYSIFKEFKKILIFDIDLNFFIIKSFLNKS